MNVISRNVSITLEFCIDVAFLPVRFSNLSPNSSSVSLVEELPGERIKGNTKNRITVLRWYTQGCTETKSQSLNTKKCMPLDYKNIMLIN